MADKSCEDSLLEKVLRLKRLGLDTEAIADRLGCALATVKHYVQPSYKPRETRAMTQRSTRKEAGLSSYGATPDPREALYNPARDGVHVPDNPTAYHMGDPPPGRREMLERWARENQEKRKGNPSPDGFQRAQRSRRQEES